VVVSGVGIGPDHGVAGAVALRRVRVGKARHRLQPHRDVLRRHLRVALRQRTAQARQHQPGHRHHTQAAAQPPTGVLRTLPPSIPVTARNGAARPPPSRTPQGWHSRTRCRRAATTISYLATPHPGRLA